MFDFSFSELIIVGVVGLLVIGPDELPSIIKNVRKIIAKVKLLSREFTSAITEGEEFGDLKKEADKINQDLKTIIDLEGNEQPTYDISDVMPEVRTGEKSN